MASDDNIENGVMILVRLHPGNLDDEIHISTLTPSYTSTPGYSETTTEYSCISYISSGTQKEILRDNQPYLIDSALANALRALRSAEAETLWWAEGLTTNTESKAVQSAEELKIILQHAEMVRLWVDNGDTHGPQAVQMLQELAEQWRTFATEMSLPDNWSRARPNQMMQIIQRVQQMIATNTLPFTGLQDTAIVECATALAESPFFRHVNAITSVVLAKEAIVTINGASMPWIDYSDSLNLIGASGGTLPVKCNTTHLTLVGGIKIAVRRWRENNQHLELLPMLQQTRQSECADPRDRIFSMLPITSPSKRIELGASAPQTPLQVDYTKSQQQVFIDAAKYIVSERQDLLLWNAIPAPSKPSRLSDLPSWVPDWSDATDVAALKIRPSMALRTWEGAACVQQVQKPLSVTDEGILRAQAHIFSPVRSVAEERFTDENFQTLFLKLLHLLPPSETMHGKDDLPRTLMLDLWKLSDKVPRSVIRTFISFTAKIQALKMLGITPEQFIADPSIVTRLAPAVPDLAQQHVFRLAGKYDTTEISKALTQSLGRRFFVLENGHLGLSYVEQDGENDEECKVRPGDVVAVFVGGYLPYLLRECGRSEEGVKRYEILGEAHVQGLMEAEALKNKGWIFNSWRDVQVDDVEIV